MSVIDWTQVPPKRLEKITREAVEARAKLVQLQELVKVMLRSYDNAPDNASRLLAAGSLWRKVLEDMLK